MEDWHKKYSETDSMFDSSDILDDTNEDEIFHANSSAR